MIRTRSGSPGAGARERRESQMAEWHTPCPSPLSSQRRVSRKFTASPTELRGEALSASLSLRLAWILTGVGARPNAARAVQGNGAPARRQRGASFLQCTAPHRTAPHGTRQPAPSHSQHRIARHSTATRPPATLVALYPLSRLTATWSQLSALFVLPCCQKRPAGSKTRGLGGKGGRVMQCPPRSCFCRTLFPCATPTAQRQLPLSLSLSLCFPPPNVRPPSRPIGGGLEWIRGFEINLVACSRLACPTCSVSVGFRDARLPKKKKKKENQKK